MSKEISIEKNQDWETKVLEDRIDYLEKRLQKIAKDVNNINFYGWNKETQQMVKHKLTAYFQSIGINK